MGPSGLNGVGKLIITCVVSGSTSLDKGCVSTDGKLHAIPCVLTCVAGVASDVKLVYKLCIV